MEAKPILDLRNLIGNSLKRTCVNEVSIQACVDATILCNAYFPFNICLFELSSRDF